MPRVLPVLTVAVLGALALWAGRSEPAPVSRQVLRRVDVDVVARTHGGERWVDASVGLDPAARVASDPLRVEAGCVAEAAPLEVGVPMASLVRLDVGGPHALHWSPTSGRYEAAGLLSGHEVAWQGVGIEAVSSQGWALDLENVARFPDAPRAWLVESGEQGRAVAWDGPQGEVEVWAAVGGHSFRCAGAEGPVRLPYWIDASAHLELALRREVDRLLPDGTWVHMRVSTVVPVSLDPDTRERRAEEERKPSPPRRPWRRVKSRGSGRVPT